MSDAGSSILSGHHGATAGGPSEAGIVFSEARPFALTQLAAWPDALPRMAAEVIRLSGAAEAPAPGRSVAGDKALVLRVEPLTWWLLHDPALTLEPLADAESGVMLSLTDARVQLCLEGPRVEALLGHFLPLDLRPQAFPEGRVAATAMHQIGIVLWRTATGFNLLLPRSYAASLWEPMAESARQYGFDIRLA